MNRNSLLKRIDWTTVGFYFIFLSLGWLNIYSSSATEQFTLKDLSSPYARQFYWILFCIPLIILCFAIKPKFVERFSSVFYILSIFSLLGLFLFGVSVSGAKSWYDIGFTRFQPSELVKVTTALALAKFLEDLQVKLTVVKNQLIAFFILSTPILLIVLQPDPGSALIFISFLLTLHREHLPRIYLITISIAIILFITTISFGDTWVISGILILAFLAYFLTQNNSKRLKIKLSSIIFIVTLCTSFVLTVNYVFEHVLEKHHRDRLNIVLGKSKDTQGIGYNLEQSLIAIGSGGLSGKGFLEGTQTKGNFVPEQHTDFIFSTIGEEWGFVGSFTVIALFTLFFLRLVFLAERQKKRFDRVFGYGVISILFGHFFVNIGMVTGLLPTIGIPLPFFSYGGSSLWSFTIMLFLFLRIDASRKEKERI